MIGYQKFIKKKIFLNRVIEERTISYGKVSQECGIQFFSPTFFICFLFQRGIVPLLTWQCRRKELWESLRLGEFLRRCNKRNETGNYRRVYFGNEGSGNGKGGKAEEGAADSSSRRKIPEPTVPILAAAGVEFDIYGCERGAHCRVCVRRIIRRLYSRNNRPEFQVNRFAADIFPYVFYMCSMENIGRSQKKRRSRNFVDSSNRSSAVLVSPFAFPNLDRCRLNRRRLITLLASMLNERTKRFRNIYT